MFRPRTFAIAFAAAAACTSTGLALAADGSTPPSGALQLKLKPQSFHVSPQRHADAPPSPGDTSITTYRVFDASGAKRLGRAHFVCVAVDRQREQCAGTIALPGGQIATQGDAENVAVVGGSGAYAGARGTATGQDHEDSVDVTVQFLR